MSMLLAGDARDFPPLAPCRVWEAIEMDGAPSVCQGLGTTFPLRCERVERRSCRVGRSRRQRLGQKRSTFCLSLAFLCTFQFSGRVMGESSGMILREIEVPVRSSFWGMDGRLMRSETQRTVSLFASFLTRTRSIVAKKKGHLI